MIAVLFSFRWAGSLGVLQHSDRPAASEESRLWVRCLQQWLENSCVAGGQTDAKTRGEVGGVGLPSLGLMMQNKAEGNFRQWLKWGSLLNPCSSSAEHGAEAL